MNRLLPLCLALGATLNAQAGPVMDRIQSSGRIVIAHRESSVPFSYVLPDGKPVGYAVDLCLKLADAVRQKLKLKSLSPQFLLVTPANRIQMVAEGKADLECGSTTNNAARQKDVAFAVTTYVEEVRIAVKANSGITSINQLNGKTVATTTGTTSVQTLRKHERATGVDFKEVFGKDHADSFLLLESGRADAFVMDGQILAGNISKSKAPKDFKIVGEVLSVEPIACMLRKDDAGFKKVVDAALTKAMTSGEAEKIYANVPGGYRETFNDNVVLVLMIETVLSSQAAKEIGAPVKLAGVRVAAEVLGTSGGVTLVESVTGRDGAFALRLLRLLFPVGRDFLERLRTVPRTHGHALNRHGDDVRHGLRLDVGICTHAGPERRVLFEDADLDLAVAVHHDGAAGQRVRMHGHHDNGIQLRVHDRAAGREVVGGGTRGRREDQAIAGVLRHELAVGIDLKPHEAGVLLGLDQDIVERELARAAGGTVGLPIAEARPVVLAVASELAAAVRR